MRVLFEEAVTGVPTRNQFAVVPRLTVVSLVSRHILQCRYWVNADSIVVRYDGTESYQLLINPVSRSAMILDFDQV